MVDCLILSHSLRKFFNTLYMVVNDILRFILFFFCTALEQFLHKYRILNIFRSNRPNLAIAVNLLFQLFRIIISGSCKNTYNRHQTIFCSEMSFIPSFFLPSQTNSFQLCILLAFDEISKMSSFRVLAAAFTIKSSLVVVNLGSFPGSVTS